MRQESELKCLKTNDLPDRSSQNKRLTRQSFSRQTTYRTELLKTNDLPDRASQDKRLTGQSFSRQTTYQTELLKTNDLPDRASQDKRLTGQSFSRRTTYRTELLKTNNLPDRASQDKRLTGQSFLCKKLDINIFIGVQLSQAGLNGPLYRAARLTDYQINRSLSRQGLMEACIELQDQQIIRFTGAYPDRAYWKLVSCYKINRVSGDYPSKAYGSLY